MLLVLLGTVVTPTPLPAGLLLFGMGSALLLVESRIARRMLYVLRRASPALSRHLARVAPRLPGRMQRVLRRIDPWRRG